MLQHGVNFGDSCDAIKIGVSICYNTLWCGVFGASMMSHASHMHFSDGYRLRPLVTVICHKGILVTVICHKGIFSDGDWYHMHILHPHT